MKMENIYKPRIAKISKIEEETGEIKKYRINLRLKHEPGQFMEVSVFNIGEAPISLCSYSKDYIELCVRNVGNVTNALSELKRNDAIGIRGPYGHGYPMGAMEGKDIIIIGGGTGVSPIRSVIGYIEKNRKDFGDVHIFLGFKSPEEILFKKDMKKWAKKFNLQITVDKADRKWKGPVGVITKILGKSGLHSRNKTAIVCGPPIMIKFAVQALKLMGFDDSQIYVSLERLMQCGLMKCGHCIVKGKYICKDGPVFNYHEAKFLED